jgi:Fe-S cluster assembly protein SufD
MNSKPELEIYADDVKCSHGSTTGQMDEEAIFYLRTRGISDQSARALMTQAFIGDVLNQIDSEEVRSYIESKLIEIHGWTI